MSRGFVEYPVLGVGCGFRRVEFVDGGMCTTYGDCVLSLGTIRAVGAGS